MSSDKRNKAINDDSNDRHVISSTLSSSTSTSSKNDQQQQQSQKLMLQSVQNQAVEEDKNKRSTDEIAKCSPPSVGAEESVTVVRMRNRPLSQIQQQV